jgi:hypothetical protein
MVGIITIILFVLTFLDSHKLVLSIIIAVSTNMILLLLAFIQKQVLNIKIDSDNGTIIIRMKKIYKEEIAVLLINEIDVSFKNEIGAKGTIRPSFRIKRGSTLIIEIVPGISGWSNDILETIERCISKIKTNNF